MARPFYNITDNVIINVSLLEEIIYEDDNTITLKFNSGFKSSYDLNEVSLHFKNFLFSLQT
jgi:hypothetical protein